MEFKFKPSYKQHLLWEYFKDPSISTILYGGGMNSGKTFGTMALVAFYCMQYPGIRVGVGRADLSTLKGSTFKTLLKVFRTFDIQRGADYKYNEVKGEVKFTNGSEIVFIDLFRYPSDMEMQNLGGLELTFCVAEEVAELEEEAVAIFSGRCGRCMNKEYGITPKTILTCNPTKGWVFKDFYLPHKNKSLHPSKRYIPATYLDNPDINHKEYEEYQRTILKGANLYRLLYGMWEYEDNDPNRLIDNGKIEELYFNDHIEPSERKKQRYLSCDLAMKRDKCVICLWKGLILDKVFVLNKESRTTGKKIVEFIEKLKIKYKIPNSNIAYDNDGIGAFLGGGEGAFFKGCKEIHNGSKPLPTGRVTEQYDSLKSQLYYKMAEYANENKFYIKDSSFRKEIMEELEFVKAKEQKTGNSKQGVMAKNDVKKYLGRSCDFSDAIAYRFYFELNPNAGKIAFRIS